MEESRQDMKIDSGVYPLYDRVRQDHAVSVYIGEQNKSMKALHYTEHSFAHVGIVTRRTYTILTTLGADAHETDLALCAGWLHDIGNIVNRVDHSQSGAMMAPVSRISAALILADKSDVRRSRVQEADERKFDIHDRVNFSVTESSLKISPAHDSIDLSLAIDTRYGEIGEYFEIFMDRMLLCRKAAEFLGLAFHLIINGQTLM